MSANERLRIRVGNQTMASVKAPTLAQAERQAFPYALQYREEGEVTVQRWRGVFWKRHALFAALPAPVHSEGQRA